MKLTAVIPMEINGVRRQGDGVRRHTFWKEVDFVVPVVTEAEAPVVIYWDAAFDPRHRFVSRDDWGPYPVDGQQVVRHHAGAFWRQCLQFDASGGDLVSAVLDADTLEAAFTRPTRNDLVGIDGSVSVGSRKPTVKDEREILYIVANDLANSRARTLESKLALLELSLLIVGDTVYRKCAEPVAVLSDCAIMDRQENTLRLVKIETDGKTIEELLAKRPDLVVPVTDFDVALEEASDGFDPMAAVEFNDRRRPVIPRRDLLSDLDTSTMRAVNEMRRFKDLCFEFEDSLEECTSAFEKEYHGDHLSKARFHFDNRPVLIAEDRKTPRP